jgi:hypothetical protein
MLYQQLLQSATVVPTSSVLFLSNEELTATRERIAVYSVLCIVQHNLFRQSHNRMLAGRVARCSAQRDEASSTRHIDNPSRVLSPLLFNGSGS